MDQDSEARQMLESLCLAQGIALDQTQLSKLVRYGELLGEWNIKINLISRKEDAPVILKHVFHSLLISLHHPFSEGEKVLDLGTGGGLPGIPLAIAFPKTDFLLVDATGKKITACKAMITALGLENATAVHSRVEELKGLAFDTVLSRQVAPLADLARYARPLLKKGGILACLKGGNLKKEIADALKEGAETDGFPSNVELHPIDDISPFFSEKQIVIAARQ
ncbi:MAG: ribosomal RNA small subunit methyltransferase G [Pelodictyon luteolum]|uniref:Ribosomal RNA small subunit methyltransferase G n=1 Tax=Pelodictyon luteolum TaxID=1100 RepID=A0A165LAD1_PELLU|nr:16S rRNA (guanine(527)-N(7))-methyltransferase RsmG [Pelodictyon luteolum]KZK73778.1 MAG: ribosomal RNA small subunit methyltransferase G [Pelodictyon luteolum]